MCFPSRGRQPTCFSGQLVPRNRHRSRQLCDLALPLVIAAFAAFLAFAAAPTDALEIPRPATPVLPSAPPTESSFFPVVGTHTALCGCDGGAHSSPPSSSPSQNLLSASAILPVGGIVQKGFGIIATLARVAARELKALSAIQAGLFVAVFLIGVQLGRTTPFWRRMTSVLDIPSKFFGPTAPIIRGRVVSVSDGDTIRLLHVPTPFSRSTIEKKGPKKEKVSEIALPIRVCTIDTPETAKFGKPGQPFGIEAKEKMKELVENKIVAVRLLMKDQYGRAVATVFSGRWPFRRAVDEIMLEDGLAEVYQGSGAVYGQKGVDEYLKLQDEAKEKSIGIWSQKERESAAEYKRRTK